MNRRFLFLIASGRREGNTETLARIAASALSESVEQQWIHLDELPLSRFEDIRHHPERNDPWPEPEGNERVLLDATLAATDIVFVTPVYWYSLPSSAKLYLDHWSTWLRTPSIDFKKQMAGKKLWTVCVLADEDPNRAELLIATLRRSAEYMNMSWGGELIGSGSKPGDILKDRRAIEAAEHFFAVAPVEEHATRK
jgi:multimeric flavodoxin WrbA